MKSDCKFDYLKNQLDDFKKSNIYRYLLSSNTKGNDFHILGKTVINLCSNDCLSLSKNKLIIESTKKAMKQISQCSSRLLSGNHENIELLEEILSKHRSSESGLVYPTGYMANLGVISSISTENHTIFSDNLNHASIIDACRLSRSKKIEIFKHNDPSNLEKLLKKNESKKIIVTEGIFSMDGDMVKLDQISEVAKKYNAIMIIDDAHSDFVFGKYGNYGGIPEYYKVEKDIDIHVSSLSKALGCFGGYVTSSQLIKEYLINRSRQFIYTSAIPEHLSIAAIKAIDFLKKNNNIQKKLLTKTSWFTNQLKDLGFNVGNTVSHIIPIIVGSEKITLLLSRELFDRGIFIQAIRYPTVSLGESRLRLSMNYEITDKQMLYVISCLETLGKKYKLL